ncbi:MAG TPA: dTDP-4-dehydrorhamnose 3,5-epimerase family protein [Fimbriimonadaceae bacterium]|nr:dTDP-4-dehydrorhamnose 3,5-epimerase family protein [Fimbriimonadaceae bacterium]
MIPGVVIKEIKRFTDERGWLMELFRDDELPDGFEPTMGYLSMTKPGVSRGPHEHVDQTDGFVFLNGEYELYLWENRDGNEQKQETHKVGAANPVLVFVPPGVVHAYRNVGKEEAFVLNFPNRLYAGWGKKEPVDEIRHEDFDSKFKLP